MKYKIQFEGGNTYSANGTETTLFETEYAARAMITSNVTALRKYGYGSEIEAWLKAKVVEA